MKPESDTFKQLVEKFYAASWNNWGSQAHSAVYFKGALVDMFADLPEDRQAHWAKTMQTMLSFQTDVIAKRLKESKE